MLVVDLARQRCRSFLFRRQRYGPANGRADGIVELSSARNCRPAKRCGPNSARGTATGGGLSEEGTLKMQLKLRWRTRTGWKGAFEVSDCLQQRIGVQTLGRLLFSAEPGPEPVQPSAQFLAQPVECLQREGQAQLFRGCFE